MDRMDKERLKKLAGNPKFIPGIYNSCDRWCERCPFTSRCLNFAVGEEQFNDPKSRDINNKAFWAKLSETFRLTLEMLKEMAEEEGIDLDSIDLEKGVEEERRRRVTAKNHECSRAAKVYGEMVDNWFDSAKGLFEKKGDELSLKVRLEIPDVNPIGEAASLKDAVEIIRWYQHQIYVKLMRAIRGSLQERPEILDEFPRDSDGSAKVALIAMDRSIAAWGEIGNHFPEREDDILDLLVHLDRLRRKTEKVFPAARAFVRPGFDEVEHG
ncbi:hypothetical protein ISS37_09300 [candidate division KSB1 bacterium]|nr:hypothetical protein [candidate division KSB1 bacterium]